MSKWVSILTFVYAFGISAQGGAHAQVPAQVQGSDTLARAMTDAIVAGGLSSDIVYVGGGSGLGESALLLGTQGIAPMSRAVSAQAAEQAAAQGIQLVEHVFGLDAIGVFVSRQRQLPGLSLDLLRRIYACELVRWEDVPGSRESGPIVVYRRNDASGTTDTFRHVIGLRAFGSCATVVDSTEDIASLTASDVHAIGYAGLSALREGNQALAVSSVEGDPFVPATVATIRSGSYPLARRLYVYEVSGARAPSAIEAQLLGLILDRGFMDPIVQDNGFLTLSD